MIIASFGNGVRTSSQWRCIDVDQTTTDWLHDDFDDSNWIHAIGQHIIYLLLSYAGDSHGHVVKINHIAKREV